MRVPNENAACALSFMLVLRYFVVAMAIKSVDALVLHAADLERSKLFYETLGLSLAREQHGEGPVHFTCKIDGLHFGIYEGQTGTAVERPAGGATMFGFQVDDLQSVATALTGGRFEIHTQLQDVPWGRRLIARDPDGRLVELNQAK